MPVDTQFLKRRLEAQRANKTAIEAVWDEVEKYVMPLTAAGRGELHSESGVRWFRGEVWDSTAVDALQRFSSSIHGAVTSPAIRWFKLGFRDGQLQKDTDACKWLDEVGEIIWADLQESDFNQEIGATYKEFVGLGNMVLGVEAMEPDPTKPWKGLDFTGVPCREVNFEPDAHRGWLRLYRDLDWYPGQIVDKFRGHKRPLPEKIVQAAQSADAMSEKRRIVWALWRREEGEVTKGNLVPPERRPIGSVYFDGETGEQLGDEGGYYEEPVFQSPWDRTAGSVWGHGPAIIALPSIKSLNGWVQLRMNAAAKVVDPPFLTEERGLLSDPDLRPGGMTVVADLERSMKPFESGTRFDVAQEEITELRAFIRLMFHVDDLQLKESPAMTATEVQVRYELMNRVLGSTLARLTTGILDPMLRTVLGIELRAGRLPPMPEQVKKAGGEATVQYLGPLSRSQRTDEVASIERFLALDAAAMKSGFVLAGDLVDVDGMMRAAAERLGVPAQLLRPQHEVDRIRAQRAEMQKRAAEAEIASVQADALAKAGQIPQPAQPTPLVAPTLG